MDGGTVLSTRTKSSDAENLNIPADVLEKINKLADTAKVSTPWTELEMSILKTCIDKGIRMTAISKSGLFPGRTYASLEHLARRQGWGPT